jgi:hypothetical protein
MSFQAENIQYLYGKTLKPAMIPASGQLEIIQAPGDFIKEIFPSFHS